MISYDAFVQSICKPGAAIKEDLTPTDAHLLHMAVGIAGEAGELLDAIKKATIYSKPLDYSNVVEELGDLEFYMQGLRNTLRISRQDCIDANVVKLTKRYSAGQYSNEQAQRRADKVDETCPQI